MDVQVLVHEIHLQSIRDQTAAGSGDRGLQQVSKHRDYLGNSEILLPLLIQSYSLFCFNKCFILE